ncbi:uncharacterized protein LOC135171585 [Diachasmimorpha longicaudata]|uniref:uncharacterized protein LOC135171585 n=1 Tax=Diachasmimorpha longicaudata TaxID=58733 RepID=UPI0030B880AD
MISAVEFNALVCVILFVGVNALAEMVKPIFGGRGVYYLRNVFPVDTYSNKRLIISRHIRLLLQPPKQDHETSKGLFKLVDDTRQHIEMLRAMEVEPCEEMIVIVLEDALHRLTADDWDKTLGKNSFPKLDDLLEFMSHRATRLASREMIKTASSNAMISSNQSDDRRGLKRTHARAFLSSTERVERDCSICNKESHPLFKCECFKSMSAAQRFQIAKEKAYCYNCLRNNHRSSDCYSTSSCRVCSERHNTLLHAAFNPKKNDKPHQDNKEELLGQTSSS